ncbi:MAG: alpha-glucan family phosphorylase [Nitrospirae bacterium]|nr:alpha-glucan family phosphorylase [Candidatus Manganitrophaceae bacterium]
MEQGLQIPQRISRLEELAYNLWWSWHPEARALFEAIDRPLWKQTNHNPVKVLAGVSSERLAEAAEDPTFLRRYDAVLKALDSDLGQRETWFGQRFPDLARASIAYFSAEFGLHNSLPIYSGGLGLLAGDHCKEAGDLGIPLVGVGFLYPQGYFHQKIQADGWQEATYRPLDLNAVAIRPTTFPTGQKLVEVPVGPRSVYIAVWEVRVGRVRLYLMDTDVPENAPWDRELSARLYGGDQELRIRQEIVLGIGGVRLLRALGIAPTIWHCNEGHTSFLMLERIREGVAAGKSFEEAAEAVRKSSIFTTHTPVPAGHDAFPASLIEKYFSNYWPTLGLDQARFWALGRNKEPWGEAFNMTVLALHLSNGHNAVSRLHGEVSRRMWQHLWPDTDVEKIPILSITNGVHVPTWVAPEMNDLYKKYLSPDWVHHHDDSILWQRVMDIPDDLLWETRQHMKRKLLGFIRERARTSWIEDRVDPIQLLAGGTLLDPEALTIGFARRFTAYKRATLLFHSLERLKKILGNRWRPVQIVFAGKAHPADEVGKRLIQQIYSLAKDSGLAGHIAFVENYDMHVAHFFIQGVDVWLNTPRAPLEASGTSGMKASLNGVPQLSILDGWWPEGYNGSNGWTFGLTPGASLDSISPEMQDAADAESLYRILENEVIPLYYRRDADGVPRGWIQTVKEAVRSVVPSFCARRMVKEYADRLYAPAARGSKE